MHNANAANQAVPLETYGGLVTLVRPENVPEGASPRNYDMDFLVGSAQTRAGLENVYSFEDASVGPNAGSAAANVALTGAAWANPAGALTADGAYAQCTPGSGSDGLQVRGFGFNLPETSTPTGITVAVRGYATSAVTLGVQLLVGGVAVGAVKTVALPAAPGVVTLGSARDLWGTALSFGDVNNAAFGVQLTATSDFALGQGLVDAVTVEVGLVTGSTNFNFIGTFVGQDGGVKNASLDAAGNFWVEDVSKNPGVLRLAFDGVTPNSFASAVNGPAGGYVAFNDLTAGSDVPRQYTADWTDRISQVGPGASPVFSAGQVAATTFAIASIEQPAQQYYSFAFGLASTGPGTQTPGNVVTQYYADSTLRGPDTDLLAAFNSGNPTYVFVSRDNTTDLVTSMGLGYPPGQSRQFYYFTYNVPAVAYQYNLGQHGYNLTYQRTLAKLTTAVPVPQLTVGAKAVVTGSSVSAWNQTWPITQTLNSGTMAMTQTSLSGGVATYTYAVLTGANPAVGQLVTVTNTLNANGTLNVVDAQIASVVGTSQGTFTVQGFSAAQDYAAVAEDGQGATAGTEFAFEPALATLGTANDPIYGNGVGGQLVETASGQFIGPGTREGVVFFITRNGYYTAPGPPVRFTTPENTTAIAASLIPIGPPNVIARGIAFTEAGQDGVPGANYFTIPSPVDYVVAGVTYTATSLMIPDNTSTTATFRFTDAVLLAAEAIDVQGNNLFNLIEIGDPGFIVSYDSRNFYGLCRNKIQNFTNLSFDGGYLPGGQRTPLGWTAPDEWGQLIDSAIFGNSYYANNGSGATAAVVGRVTQTAYQDAYQQPILSAKTTYSVRVTARIPSGQTGGSLVVDLADAGFIYGAASLAFGDMTSSFGTYTLELLTSEFATVPAGLQLRVYGAGMAAGADVEIDRVDVFPTKIPVLSTTLFGSYANDLESVDGVTGPVKFTSENQQPLNGAVVLYDTLYGLKESSMYALDASANLEPAQWNEPEVAQRAGACGVNAYDFGEQWIVEACRNGLYLFAGGQPGKIMQEIYQVWDAIYWPAGKSIWVRNDVTGRRLFVGVPLPTPNFWLPDAPVNATPDSPNVILMCNYQGLESGEELKTETSLRVTVYGSLNTMDLRRKWSIWQIASPYAAAVSTAGTVSGEGNVLDAEMRFCNGIASSKVYRLKAESMAGEVPTDDGVAIDSLYTTHGFVNIQKAAQMPLLGLFRKLWTYMTHQFSGTGRLRVRLLPNILVGPEDAEAGYFPWTLPGGFDLTDPCTQVREAPLNFAATRTFVELRTAGRMSLSNLVLVGRKHIQNALTGRR